MKILYLSPDADQREFESIGEAASYEEMLRFFNSFDWENGKKVIARRQELDLPYFPQILRFQKSATDFLDVQPARKDEFFVSCVNGNLVFEDEISGNVHRANFTIEEFLGDFWDGNLTEKYNFEELNEKKGAALYAESSASLIRLWPLALAFCLSLWTLNRLKPVTLGSFLMSLFPFVFVLPYTIIFLQYFRHSKNGTLSVSKKDKTLSIVTKGNPRTIRIRDITKSKIVINKSPKSGTYGWGYLMLEVGPKDRIAITHFLYEELDALAELLGLKPVRFNSIYPLITFGIKSDKQLLEEKKEHEFVEKWSGKSKEELMVMKKNPSAYAKYALEAMNILLKKK